VEIPLVSVGDDGRVFTVGGNEGKTKFELVNTEKRKLTLGDIPFSLTCALHQDCVLVDPTSKEESIIESSVTVVVDSSDRLVSVQKLGGAGIIKVRYSDLTRIFYKVNISFLTFYKAFHICFSIWVKLVILSVAAMCH
jgi:exosome complex RNA-binding protein Rrp42 (RNase PH superfamily)